MCVCTSLDWVATDELPHVAPSTKETSICFLITLSHCNYERGNGETRLTHSDEFIDELNEARNTNEFGVRTWETEISNCRFVENNVIFCSECRTNFWKRIQ